MSAEPDPADMANDATSDAPPANRPRSGSSEVRRVE